LKKIIWTAIAPYRGFTNSDFVFVAQEKSSRTSLERRVRKDDPVWGRETIFKRLPMMDKSKFRRGLAITYMPRSEAYDRGYL
jgi:hypothetical protein